MIDSLIRKYFPDGLARNTKPLSTSSWHYRLFNLWLKETSPENKYWSHDLDVCTYRSGVIQACGWWFWHRCWPDRMLGFAIRPPIVLTFVALYVVCTMIMVSTSAKNVQLVNLVAWIYLQLAILATAWLIERDQIKSADPGNWFFQIIVLIALPILLPFVILLVIAGTLFSFAVDPLSAWYQQSMVRAGLMRLRMWVYLPISRFVKYIWNWFWRKNLYKGISPWMIIATIVYLVALYITQWAKIITAGIVLAIGLIIVVLYLKELVEFVVDKTLAPKTWNSFRIVTTKKKRRKTAGILRLIGMFITSWYYGICYRLQFIDPDSEQDEVPTTS